MIRAKDQLGEEATYSHLAKFLRAGGTLEIGEDWSLGGFAKVRMGNQTLGNLEGNGFAGTGIF